MPSFGITTPVNPDSVAFSDRQGCEVDAPAWAQRRWPHRVICLRDEALRHDEW